MPKDIIEKLKSANLLGRGGASFPTYLKWQMVKDTPAKKKYVVCNVSEGELDVFKDGFILENYPTQIVEGLKIALKTIDHSYGYIFLRKDYYQKYKKRLEKLTKNLPITIFKEKGGYLSGEETVVCQEIEEQILRPRKKPPFPGQTGIDGSPTLINNLETFYYVALIAKNQYKYTRFYAITGDIKHKGVFELPLDWSLKRILKETGNWLVDQDFFAQVGGGASGDILLPSELNRSINGVGSLIIFDKAKTDLYQLMERWVNFFMKENCDKCTPCREGIYRLREMIKQRKIESEVLKDLWLVLEETSFCALGKSVATPFRSLIKKVLT